MCASGAALARAVHDAITSQGQVVMRPMPPKTVYLNDIPVGEASTWNEAFALLKTKGVRFIGTPPGTAEGPSGFYVHAALLRPVPEPGTEDRVVQSSSEARD